MLYGTDVTGTQPGQERRQDSGPVSLGPPGRPEKTAPSVASQVCPFVASFSSLTRAERTSVGFSALTREP